MSAVVISTVASPPASPRCGRPACPPVGVLADGTPFYAAIGEVAIDGPLVTCHLCGRALRSVTAHLRVHGWTKQAYCEAFGLERGQSLEGHETRKLRAAAFTSRLVFDPAVRTGSAAGRERARAGELTRDAAAAARGRRHPEQRRRKARQAMAVAQAAVIAQANTERARARLAERHLMQYWTVNAIAAEVGMSHHAVGAALRRHGLAPTAHAAKRHAASKRAARVAARHGFDSITSYIAGRRAAGWTWRAMSEESGQPPSWLRRQGGNALAVPRSPDALTRAGRA